MQTHKECSRSRRIHDRDKDYSKHKRRNEALHGYATLESRDGKRNWAQDSNGLNSDDEYDKFNESNKLEKKLGRDETFTVKSGDGDYDDNNDTHDLGLDDSKRALVYS